MQSGGGGWRVGQKNICRGLKDNQPSVGEEGKGEGRTRRRELQVDRATYANHPLPPSPAPLEEVESAGEAQESCQAAAGYWMVRGQGTHGVGRQGPVVPWGYVFILALKRGKSKPQSFAGHIRKWTGSQINPRPKFQFKNRLVAFNLASVPLRVRENTNTHIRAPLWGMN